MFTGYPTYSPYIAKWSSYGGTCSTSMDIFAIRKIQAAFRNSASYLSHRVFRHVTVDQTACICVRCIGSSYRASLRFWLVTLFRRAAIVSSSFGLSLLQRRFGPERPRLSKPRLSVLNALAPIVIWFTGACARRLRLKQASNRPIPANHQSKENYTKARILHQGLGITSIELCFQYKRLWNSTAITYRLLAVMLMSTGTLFSLSR